MTSMVGSDAVEPAEAEPVIHRTVVINAAADLHDAAYVVAESWNTVLPGAVAFHNTQGYPVRLVTGDEAWVPCIVNDKPMSCKPNGRFDGNAVLLNAELPPECIERTLAHEVGHLLGLPHLVGSSLMADHGPSRAERCVGWVVDEVAAEFLLQ